MNNDNQVTHIICHDCNVATPPDEGNEWTPWDFTQYSFASDILFICDACWHEPAHVARREEDRADDEAANEADEESEEEESDDEEDQY